MGLAKRGEPGGLTHAFREQTDSRPSKKTKKKTKETKDAKKKRYCVHYLSL